MSEKPPVKQFITLVILVAVLTIGAQMFSNNRPAVSTSPTPTADTSAAADVVVTEATRATIETNKGTIVIAFYPSDAPKTAKNFVGLAQKSYYDGLTFHRVEPGFVIQGGDPSGNGSGGTSLYGDTFEDELNKDTASYKAGYKKGVVAMANRGPNTNGSQFFILLEDTPDLPKSYTIFGHVVEGQDVVDTIAVGDTMNKVVITQ